MWAGQYIVRAAAAPGVARNGKEPPPSYPTLFYPSATMPEDAMPLLVASGAETQANITLRPGPAFHIAGRIDSAGSDEEVCFGLAPKRYNSALTQVIGRVVRFGKDGVFLIDDVPPGSYVMSAALCHGVPPLGAIVPLDVAGNIEGLNIPLGAGTKVSGVVKGEGVDVSGVRLILRSPELLSGYVSHTMAGKDGAFVFENVLGLHHMVDFSALPIGAYVKSVQYAGREAPASGFELDGNGAIEITLSSQGAGQIAGTVLDKSGSPVPYARVTVLPAAGGPAESASDVMTDDKGAFTFPALRPGTYKALAWQTRYNPFGLEAADPGLPLLFETSARTVTLNPGAPVSVALTLNTEEDVNRARAAARMTPPKNP